MTGEIRKNKIKNAIRLIENSKHLTAFTGAGVSTDSGIPDVNGIIKILDKDKNFSGNPFKFSSSNYAINHTEEFYKLYRKTFFQKDAQPNYTHKFLAKLEKGGILKGIATMNVDWLHKMAGSKNVYEYWGNIRNNRCIECNTSYDWDILKNEKIPICKKCGHKIIPEFIMRNLAPYPDKVQQGTELINKSDVLLILGTNRNTSSFPVATKKIIVNREIINGYSNDDLNIKGDSNSIFKEFMSYFYN